MYKRPQSKREEIANSITHGIGTALSIVGLVVLVIYGARNKNVWQIVSFSIFGATMIFMYLMSTLYHGITAKKVKRVFHALDHSSIYLLIVGTYTAVLLTGMRNTWGWTILVLVWTIAITGIVLKAASLRKKEDTSIIEVIIYISLGWIAIIAIKPIFQAIAIETIIWIALGGVYYTVGIVFYLWRKLPYHHLHWHLFIIAASFSHFIGMFYI